MPLVVKIVLLVSVLAPTAWIVIGCIKCGTLNPFKRAYRIRQSLDEYSYSGREPSYTYVVEYRTPTNPKWFKASSANSPEYAMSIMQSLGNPRTVELKDVPKDALLPPKMDLPLGLEEKS